MSAAANNKNNSEPSSPLTVEWDETLKAQLGMELLQALDNRAVISETERKRRWWNRLHQDYERQRLGLPVDNSDDAAGDEMANTVRIDSPDMHYHGTTLGKWMPWLLAAALGIAGATAYYLKPGDRVSPSLTDTNLTIEGH